MLDFYPMLCLCGSYPELTIVTESFIYRYSILRYCTKGMKLFTCLPLKLNSETRIQLTFTLLFTNSMRSFCTILLFWLTCQPLTAQDKPLPYYEIPPEPESFTAGTVAARMIDGLGFRFYWATEGLRPEDLSYKPNPESRTAEETIDHICQMSKMIVNSTTKTPNIPDPNRKKLTFEEMRKQTLENLKTASDILLKSTDKEMEGYKIVFKRENNPAEFPFWNQINGPIADCLWHVGQIVSFRRSSGNPFTDKVSVFTGKVIK